MNIPTKIVCVGRNYVDHAKELGNEMPERPLIFLKPPSSLIGDGDAILLPPESQRVEHEGEVAVVIGKRASRVRAADSRDYIAGIAPLNDVTARDLQKLDVQWARAKGFDTFCPVGTMVPIEEVGELEDLEVVCRVNGEERQRGSVSRMAYDIPFLIEYISGFMTLEPGDLVATGTPAGVAPLKAGDVVEVEIPGLGSVRNPVRAR